MLCILDGWGERAQRDDNAILQANTPNWDRFMARFPHARMQASESFVGLPQHQMGNSEVGHTNIGAGRVVKQDLPRIDEAIKHGELARNAALKDLVAAMKGGGGTVHLMGLLSPGGVHAHQDHIVALAKFLADQELTVNVHAFLDGRDTPPRSAIDFIAAFEKALKDQKRVRIVT
ncbi:MAG: 2,3-bisphosphoglycerate-independent phosphoglycerate mutase, partial [Stellaceae bacterium]